MSPRVFVCAAALAAAGSPAHAADSAPVTGLAQVVLALALVVAMIVAFAWLLRRLQPGHGGSSGALRVVGGLMVGPRERVVLVEVGETWLVVGVAAGHVSALHSMPRPADAAPSPAPSADGDAFAARLSRMLARRKPD